MPSIKGKETMARDKGSRISSGSSGEEFKNGNGLDLNGSVGNGAEAQNSDNTMTRTSSNDSRTSSRHAERNNRGRTSSGGSNDSLTLFESSGVISTSANNIPESSATAMRRSPGHNNTTSINGANSSSQQNRGTSLPTRRYSAPEDPSIRSTESISTDTLNETSSSSRPPVPGDPSSVNCDTPDDIELQDLIRRQLGESWRLSTAETVTELISSPPRPDRRYERRTLVMPLLCILLLLIGVPVFFAVMGG